MTTLESSRIVTALGRRSGSGGDVHPVADAVVSLWRDIELQLIPIIGPRGVAALHRRSLFLTAREYSWLSIASDGTAPTMDLDSLRHMLHLQDATAALAAAGAHFLTFHDLLTTMVGPALTERLLRDVWDPPSTSTPAQDTHA